MMANPFVQSRSSDTGAIAARGDRVKYIQREADSELYDLQRGETTHVDDEDLEALCRDVVRGQREVTAEEARLKAAAHEVADES